jgi:hypothetical protein
VDQNQRLPAASFEVARPDAIDVDEFRICRHVTFLFQMPAG